MKRIKEFFLLKDDIFFDLLLDLAKVAHECSKEFSYFVHHYDQMAEKEKIERLTMISRQEKKADEIVRKISEELYKHFITPIDREDIHTIAADLDDGIDIIEEVSKKLSYYRLRRIPSLMKKLAEIAEKQIERLKNAIENLKKSEKPGETYKEVFELEDEADKVYETAMGALFVPGTDPLLIIKLKDLYDALEDLADMNQQLAIVIEGIAIKHA